MTTALHFALLALLLTTLVEAKTVLTSPREPNARPAVVDTTTRRQRQRTPQQPRRSKWKYRNQLSPMTDEVTWFATITSTNSVRMGFPYEGGTRAHLVLRRTTAPDSSITSVEVLLYVDRGQFISPQEGGINVRLGDDKPQFFYTDATASYDYDTVFIRDPNRLIATIQKGLLENQTRLRIEAEFFREAPKVFEFDTFGLVWPSVVAD